MQNIRGRLKRAGACRMGTPMACQWHSLAGMGRAPGQNVEIGLNHRIIKYPTLAPWCSIESSFLLGLG